MSAPARGQREPGTVDHRVLAGSSLISTFRITSGWCSPASPTRVYERSNPWGPSTFISQLRRTAYNHPEGNSYIERFHRSLKEEEVWLNEYQNFAQAELNIARWIEEYNKDRPHRGLQGRTP